MLSSVFIQAPGTPPWSHRIIESLRVEKTSKIIESIKNDFKTSPLTHHSVRTGSTSHPDPSPFQMLEYPPYVQLPMPRGSECGLNTDSQGKAPLSAAATQGEISALSQPKGLGESVKKVLHLPIPKIILGVHSRTPILGIRNDNRAAH